MGLSSGAGPLRPGGRGRRVLVLGGARSGKSAFAERMLARHRSVTYVATARVGDDDPEWQDRVARHRERRPATWRTLETADLAAALRDEPGPLLVDCVTLWLTAMMDECGAWIELGAGRLGAGQPGAGRPDAEGELAGRLEALERAWRARRERAILVTNEVGAGIVPATPAGRRFRDQLGQLNTRLAGHADRVWLVTAGIPRRLR